MNRSTLVLIAFLPWVGTSCLESTKKETAASSTGMSTGLKSRILSRDPSRRSSFEKAMPSSLQPKTDEPGGFMSRFFGTKESKQGKPLAGIREFNASQKSTLAISDNRMGAQAARQDSQSFNTGSENRMASQGNRMTSQDNNMANSGFREGDSKFGTFSNFEGAAAIRKNTKPRIIQKLDGSEEMAYGEEQVRSLLNRN